MSRGMPSGYVQTIRAAASSTTFFQKVCQLVSTSASPKHPQSVTGSSIASQSVSSVITIISTTRIFETSLRLMANNRQMPSRNSVAERMTDEARVPKSGTRPATPIAAR